MPTPSSPIPAATSASRVVASGSRIRRLISIATAAALVLGAGWAVSAMSASLRGSGAPQTNPRVATAAPADTQRVVLAVKGMYCESCERTITVMLKRTPGVLSASVSLDRGDAVVLYDPARTAPAKLAAVVEQLGYPAAIKAA